MRSPQRTIGGRTFDLSRQTAVMAIVNRTPDSFHDRGRTFGLAEAIDAVDKAVSEGADWVGIGGVPFAPGPKVARQCIAGGAGVINDTSGLHDSGMAEIVADSDANLIIVHALAAPRTVFPRPSYHDVTVEVAASTEAALRRRTRSKSTVSTSRSRKVTTVGRPGWTGYRRTSCCRTRTTRLRREKPADRVDLVDGGYRQE